LAWPGLGIEANLALSFLGFGEFLGDALFLLGS